MGIYNILNQIELDKLAYGVVVVLGIHNIYRRFRPKYSPYNETRQYRIKTKCANCNKRQNTKIHYNEKLSDAKFICKNCGTLLKVNIYQNNRGYCSIEKNYETVIVSDKEEHSQNRTR